MIDQRRILGQGRRSPLFRRRRNFQKVLDHRGIVFADPIGALAHLDRALVLVGEKDKARSAYRDFHTHGRLPAGTTLS